MENIQFSFFSLNFEFRLSISLLLSTGKCCRHRRLSGEPREVSEGNTGCRLWLVSCTSTGFGRVFLV